MNEQQARELAQLAIERTKEADRLRAQVAQLQADRALLLGVAFKVYGDSMTPLSRHEALRAGAALLMQKQDLSPAVSTADAIRGILCRMAAELTP